MFLPCFSSICFDLHQGSSNRWRRRSLAPVLATAAHLTCAHGGGNHGELDREGAAETAAGFAVVQFQQLQAADVLEKLARRFFESEFAQAVAAVVER